MEYTGAFISQTCTNLNAWENGRYQSKNDVVRWDETQQRILAIGFEKPHAGNTGVLIGSSLSISRFASSYYYYYGQTDETVAKKIIDIAAAFSKNADSLIERIENNTLSEHDAINVVNDLSKLSKTSTVFQKGLNGIVEYQLSQNLKQVDPNAKIDLSQISSIEQTINQIMPALSIASSFVNTNVDKKIADIITKLLVERQEFNSFSKLDATGLSNLIVTLSKNPNSITFTRLFQTVINQNMACYENSTIEDSEKLCQYLKELCHTYGPSLPNAERLEKFIDEASKNLSGYVNNRYRKYGNEEQNKKIDLMLNELDAAIFSMKTQKMMYIAMQDGAKVINDAFNQGVNYFSNWWNGK